MNLSQPVFIFFTNFVGKLPKRFEEGVTKKAIVALPNQLRMENLRIDTSAEILPV